MLLPLLGSLVVSVVLGSPSKCNRDNNIYGDPQTNVHNAINGTQFKLSDFRVSFPCNQFGLQEPGNNDEILPGLKYVRPGKNFVPHPRMIHTEKIEVNGKTAHPLYKLLKNKCPPAGSTFGKKEWLFWDEIDINDIHWNFEKILVDKVGKARYRFEAGDWQRGQMLIPYIQELLSEHYY